MGQGGDGGAAAPPKYSSLPFLGGGKRKFGRSQFLKTHSGYCFFFTIIILLFFFMFHEFFIFIIILLFFMFLKF